jgi:hypothetical protein
MLKTPSDGPGQRQKDAMEQKMEQFNPMKYPNAWLLQVDAARWFEGQFERSIIRDNLGEKEPPKFWRERLEFLLGRKIQPGDPAEQWDFFTGIYVAQQLMRALISGCVPLPRNHPLPLGELPSLLGYELGLPHGTTWPVNQA